MLAFYSGKNQAFSALVSMFTTASVILLFLFYVLDVPLNLSYAPFSWASTVRSQEADVSG